MSDLLNKASLVMIPSGYKEDVVYSAIPTDGSGDLSFTRASNGTRINSAGLVEVTPWNLAQYSEDFSNVIWESVAVSVSANTTTAPNGTNTADTATIATAGGHNLRQNISVSPNTVYTFSFYVKRGTATGLSYSVYNNTGLQDIVPATSYYSQTSSSQWTRISVTFTTPSNCTQIYIYPLRDGSSTGTVFLWGAQLNIGSTAKPYFPTTDRLNVPRLTYQNGGGGCPSLLLEKQSTNLALYSEQFDNAAWTKYESTITANATTSLDGTQNADLLLDNSSTDAHSAYQVITASAGTLTWSVYAKAQNNNFLIISAYTGSHNRTWFNLSTGAVGTNASGNTATIENMGNGWYRCIVSRAYVSGTLVQEVGTSKTDGVFSYTGNGADGIYIWGAQLEASSYPTSYILTTSSSATRVADECAKSGIGALIGGTSGTVFFDITTNPVLSSANYKQFCYYVDSASAQSYMYLNNSNQIVTNSNWGSLSYATAFQPNTRYKVALVYAPNDFALYINGVSVATASSGTPKDNVNLQIGQFNGSEMCEFVFNQYTHFKSRLTNAELASLTTI